MVEMKKKDTKISGLALLLIGIGVLAAVLIIVALFIAVPELMQSVIWAILIIVGVIALIFLVIWILMVVLAIPFYMAKGETYQTDIDYDIKDVKPVKETSGSTEKKK